MYYSVLQSTTLVLLCTTKHYSCTTLYYKALLLYYSSTTPYYKVLLQYYCDYKVLIQYYNVRLQYYSVLLHYYKVLQCTTLVLQSTTPVLLCTTPVLLCTTKCYSSTTLYYSVLQSTTLYYSSTIPVLQRTTPVLLRTTKYYSSTTLYYKVLLQYSGTTLKRHLQCAKQQASPSNLTKYCACHAKGMSWLILLSNETSFTMRRATGITCQPHQRLRLPRKRNVMIDPSLEWNVIYNAQSNRHHLPTSPKTAPATQKECHDWSFSRMKRHLQCAKQQASPCNLTKDCACHAKGMTLLFLLTDQTSFTLRGATGISLQPHQTLRLPGKRNVMIDPSLVWNVIYNAQSNRHHPATSPNTAPATQKEWQYCSCSHMKRHLQCAEQQESPSNLTKYCSCHAKGVSWLICITYETSFTMRKATGITLQPHQILRLPRKRNVMIDPSLKWNVIYNARSNRNLPPTSPNTAPATQKECHDWSFSRMKRHLQCAKQQASPCNLTKYCACHAKGRTVLFLLTYETSFTMRGAKGITLQPHQILRLPRKMNLMIDRAHIWNVISNAQSSKSHPPTSPSTAPATQNESHVWSASHMKRHFQCAEQQASISNLTKYCAYHAK